MKPLKTVKTRQLNKRSGSIVKIFILFLSYNYPFFAFWHMTNWEEKKYNHESPKLE